MEMSSKAACDRRQLVVWLRSPLQRMDYERGGSRSQGIEMRSQKRVTVASKRVLGVWVGIVKIEGEASWHTDFMATRKHAREAAKPVAVLVRKALRVRLPLS